MNYKTNADGDVMVRDSKGNPKYISKKLAMDSQLMKAMHFEVVEAPVSFEVELEQGQMDSERLEVVAPIEEIKTEVAESVPAKPNAKKTK